MAYGVSGFVPGPIPQAATGAVLPPPIKRPIAIQVRSHRGSIFHWRSLGHILAFDVVMSHLKHIKRSHRNLHGLCGAM